MTMSFDGRGLANKSHVPSEVRWLGLQKPYMIPEGVALRFSFSFELVDVEVWGRLEGLLDTH